MWLHVCLHYSSILHTEDQHAGPTLGERALAVHAHFGQSDDTEHGLFQNNVKVNRISPCIASALPAQIKVHSFWE